MHGRKKKHDRGNYSFSSILRKDERQSPMIEEDMKPTPKNLGTRIKKNFEGLVKSRWGMWGWTRKYATQHALEQAQEQGDRQYQNNQEDLKRRRIDAEAKNVSEE